MRNKQLQEKLEAMLTKLRKQPDDTLVAAQRGHELLEMQEIGMYFLSPNGVEAEEGDKVDCIVLNI